MAKSLHKARKAIAKKRGGEVNALHVKSRDSMRLHKAGIRDMRLEKLVSARGKREQPIVDRVAYFQDGLLENGTDALELSDVQQLIHSFIHQHDEEYDEVKKARRPGRPASVREDLLKRKIASLQTEYDQGFLMPDLTTAEGVNLLGHWEGSWPYLTTLPWVKVTSAGQKRQAELPSKGLN